ncbi:phage N-6-adenine-methyltransferase [Budvicia aquatica]|uniref:Phage N-6-adenine-methyltransferase n=1 Tax=Budvicia aquatica TaxID=82979 RepID=A0A2C6C4H1_9GAMM|nr:phage N-6-adenine-methyltransferase [Budvicia aquatica]PHI31250.1 phage N-6-adenine-methyltransferase [Budvicia aquatica]GKX52796.1 phage N-6-adenine-methyltransferase [Budvicia aquatica]
MIDFSNTEYLQHINYLRSKPKHLLRDIGDQWRTPDALFLAINELYGPLVLDLFSDGQNNKCPHFYTESDNALAQDWAQKLQEIGGGGAFANPPYSRAKKHKGSYITGMSYIMKHTIAQREKGGRYVFLVKVATSEEWWPGEKADHIAFIRGRIPFDLPAWFSPANKRQEVTTASFGIAVMIFDKTWTGSPISYLSRDVLLNRGMELMNELKEPQTLVIAA